MGDQQLQNITAWLLATLKGQENIAPAELIKKGEGRYSPSDITWAIWYLKSEGRIRLTRDDLIGAA